MQNVTFIKKNPKANKQQIPWWLLVSDYTGRGGGGSVQTHCEKVSGMIWLQELTVKIGVGGSARVEDENL